VDGYGHPMLDHTRYRTIKNNRLQAAALGESHEHR
jgi:hypothetical protein